MEKKFEVLEMFILSSHAKQAKNSESHPGSPDSEQPVASVLGGLGSRSRSKSSPSPRSRSTSIAPDPNGVKSLHSVSNPLPAPGLSYSKAIDIPQPRPMRSQEEVGHFPNLSHHEMRKDTGHVDLYPPDSKAPQERAEPSLDRRPTDDLSPDQLSKLADLASLLVDQQRDASAHRSHVRELRRALRHKQNKESELLANLIRKLLPILEQSGLPESSAIQDDYWRVEAATQDYLSMENTYYQAEDSLSHNEYMLARSMEQFARLTQRPQMLDLQDDPYLPIGTDMEYDDDSSSFDSVSQELLPELRGYLSLIGDVQILQERLSELDSRYIATISKQQQRKAFHMSLDEDSSVFLDTFDAQWQAMWRELNHAQFDAVALEEICVSSGLPVDEHKSRLDIIYEFDIIYQPSEICQANPPEYIRDPLKLPDEDNNLSLEPSSVSKLRSVVFINRWMLHQLQISNREIRRLKSQPDIQFLLNSGVDDMRITHLISTAWFEDNEFPCSKPSSQDDYLTEASRSRGVSSYGSKFTLKQGTIHYNGSLPSFSVANSNKVDVSTPYGSI